MCIDSTKEEVRTLAEEELRALRRRVLVGHRVQLPGEDSGTAEEDADIRLGVLLCDGAEHPVPVRTTKVCRRAEVGDRVFLGTDVLDDDVVHVLLLDLRRQVDVDLDPVLRVLLLDCVQERVEPLRRAEVTDDPREVHLGKAGRLRVVEVVHAVPDRLQDRRERRDTDTSTDEEDGLIVQEVLGRRAEGTVNHDTGEDTVDGRVRRSANNLAAGLALFAPTLLPEVTADSRGKRTSEVTGDTDVDGDIVLLRGAAHQSASLQDKRRNLPPTL